MTKAKRIHERDGYVILFKPDHQYCDHEGYIKEHRIVYEEFYKCCLLPWTLIHHKNGIKYDNRIENLEPTDMAGHLIQHLRKDMSNRKCSDCGSNKTRWYMGKFGYKYFGWYKDGLGGWICKKCYEKKIKAQSA